VQGKTSNEMIRNATDPILQFNETVISIADETIPKTSTNPNTQENHGFFNFETQLRQEVRRICFNVLRASALKKRKLPRLSDVGCFPNFRSAFLRFLMAFLQSVNGSYSAIDLTVTDPSLLLDFSWKFNDDLCGSDHFPNILESLYSTVGERPTRYKFDKADWSLYQQMPTRGYDH
jgi:hypothetical protein